MITVEKRPAYISFAGNPLRFTVVSDSLYSNPGVKANFEMLFTGVDRTVGHYFTLSFMNMILDFVISDGNNESGLEIPAATLTDTYSSWCAKVQAAMSNNYYLHTYYDIVNFAGNGIFFIAKDNGVFYTMTFTNVNVSGISQNYHVSGVDVQTLPGLGILAQVLDQNNRIIGEDFRPVESDGRTRFNVSEYINAFLEDFSPPHFTIPGTTDKLRCFTDGLKLFHLAFCEKYEGGTNRLFVDYDLWGLMGGLSREALVYWDGANPFWEDPMNLMRFLTWCPSKKLTTQKQLERLFFFNRINTSLSLNYSVLFSDNTSQVVSFDTIDSDIDSIDSDKITIDDVAFDTIDSDIDSIDSDKITIDDVSEGAFNVSPYSIIEIQAGYSDLDLGSIDPEKEVIGWRVWLKSGDETVSEIYEFTLDPHYKEFDRQFLFRNSFGWYDVMRATGKVESTLEHERTEGYTVVEEEQTNFNAPDKNFSVLESQTFKASTGWVNFSTQNWLRDFLLSREVYEIIEGKIYPVKITSKKSTRAKDGDYNLMLDFEYSRAYKDMFFSIAPGSGGGVNPSHRNYCDSYSLSYS